MDYKKTLILRYDINKEIYFFWYTKFKNIEQVTKNIVIKKKFIWYLLIATYKFQLPLLWFFLWKWKNKLRQYENVIIFDSWFHDLLAKYIKKKNKDIKIILWYRNPINDYTKRFLKNKYVDQIYTYNEDDVMKFITERNLKYIPQFYTKNIKLSQSKINKDIFFLGRAKSRWKDLIALETKFEGSKLITDFKIIEKESDFIDYDTYLELLSKSKSLLDFNYPIISGLSLRIMEGVFLKKKVITNNYNIIKYDFYNKDNFFILWKDDIKNIKYFINSPYQIINQKIINKYDFDSWITKICS